MSFAEAIKEIRQSCYLSQQSFADELGVSFSTVNRWEKARAIPNYQTMKRLVTYCKAVGVNCDEIEAVWKKQKTIIDQISSYNMKSEGKSDE